MACLQCSMSTGPANSWARAVRIRSVNSQTALTMSAVSSRSVPSSHSSRVVMPQYSLSFSRSFM